MKNKRTIVLASVAAVSLAVFTAFIGQNHSTSLYKPSAKAEFGSGEEAEESQGSQGAAEWWFNRLKNQVTGTIDENEMIRMQELSSQAIANAAEQRNGNPSMSVQSANWTELGPDNVGGRTRAILFDNQDPNHQHMFAGGVSGGLWESNDAAAEWHRVPGYFSVPGASATIVTIAQAVNGDIYVGTGEGSFYPQYGSGAGGFGGNGIFKSTDHGVTWTSLSTTQPTTQNSTSTAWIAVNKIQCDPFNASHVYAGTNKGLKVSTDGGSNWIAATGPPTSGNTMDVEVATNGNVIAVVSNKPWLSTDGGANFVNVSGAGTGWPTNTGRVTIAIAPSDPNYVYAFIAAVAGSMQGVYVSQNGGNNWTQVTGAGNAQFEPFANGQGAYDNIVSVDPSNKHRAIFGGTALYEWDMINESPVSGQWNQIAMEFPASPFNPFYVHSDKHEIIWHPTQAGVFYVGTDGGIFRSNQTGFGLTFTPMNSGYNVTQCYSVAIENTAGAKNRAMAGCQDNGTNYVDGSGNTSMSSIATGGGDGAWCDISYLNPLATFQTVYYGALSRSNNGGVSSSNFYDARIQAITGFDAAGFASFVTPERLWESNTDVLSGDSIIIANGRISQNKDVCNGDSSHYTGTLSFPIPLANPAATLVLDSIMLYAGNDTALCDAAGNLSHDGTGTVNGATGVYNVTFISVPATNTILHAVFYVQYGAGTVFTVNSNVQGKTINHTVASQVNPGDTVKIQDVVQSHLAVGFTGNNGVWMTRRAIDFSTTPLWIKIGGTFSAPDAFSGETSCMQWSPNGDILYVGTASGNLYRFSNLGSVTDSANGDIDFKATATSTIANGTCQVVCNRIANFSGRDVSMIDVNPNNPDQVIVSLGNYSNTQYVFMTNTATTCPSSGTSSNFLDKTGNLVSTQGGAPVFTVSFDKYAANRVLVGTEQGLFETTNISSGAPSWVSANAGFDVCPVDMIRQQRWENWQVPNSGCFYIGTHGRGMWRDDSSWQPGNVGINNPGSSNSSSENTINHDLRVFPNPVVDNSNVIFNLPKQGDAIVQIYDLTGKMVYSKNFENLSMGTNTVQFETQEMVKGTYIITVLQGAKRIGSGRFIKMN